MKINKYPDGSSYAQATKEERFTFRVNTYEDLWHLNQVVDSANDVGIIPEITIPNLIDAQADRRFNRGESSGLKLVCQFLNSMETRFKIFHPHNPEVVEALMDNVEILDNTSFIFDVLNRNFDWGAQEKEIKNPKYENLILMSSDAGGFKPLMKLCDKLNWQGEVYSASKSREYKEGKSKLIQIIDREDFRGKDILIVDDICVYGGTFKGLSKLLRERNCGKLYLAVSHMTVLNLGVDPVTNYFDKVFTTNSKYDSYVIPKGGDFESPKNLEIIKLF